MKILTKQDQYELLKKLSVCQVITNKYINDTEIKVIMTEYLTEIAVKINGSTANMASNSLHSFPFEKDRGQK